MIVSDVRNAMLEIFVDIPMVATLVGMMILVIGHPPYCQLLIIVVVVGMVTDVETASVYRFIPVTVYDVSTR